MLLPETKAAFLISECEELKSKHFHYSSQGETPYSTAKAAQDAVRGLPELAFSPQPPGAPGADVSTPASLF